MDFRLPKKEIIKELKQISKKLGYSPARREIPRLASKCYQYFGSFNKAKEKANLNTKNVRITSFPKSAFKLEKNLSGIVSYLTFDGHLYNDLSGFFLCSKNIKILKNFEELVNNKFNIQGKYYLNSGGAGKTKTHKFIVFNKILSKNLLKLGVPKGDKTLQQFNVPKWISQSRDFSREYLKIAFLCEGSNKEEKGRTPRIQFNTAKKEEIIDSGFRFMNTIREMLKNFNINTTNCFISGRRVRSDNIISKDIRFRIKTEDNNKFINEIGWLK